MIHDETREVIIKKSKNNLSAIVTNCDDVNSGNHVANFHCYLIAIIIITVRENLTHKW